MSEDTYLKTLNEIEELKKKAESLRAGELGPTIERFKKAILVYGIRPEDVFSADALATSGTHTFGQTGASMDQGIVSVDLRHEPAAALYEPSFSQSAPANVQQARYSQQARYAQPDRSVQARKVRKPHRGAVAPKYANPNGDFSDNWSGRGRKPQWYIEALASGKSPESMLIKLSRGELSSSVHAQGAQMMDSARAQRLENQASLPSKPPRKQGPGYRLGDKSWTGVGPRPNWFKDAVASGKTLEQLRAN